MHKGDNPSGIIRALFSRLLYLIISPQFCSLILPNFLLKQSTRCTDGTSNRNRYVLKCRNKVALLAQSNPIQKVQYKQPLSRSNFRFFSGHDGYHPGLQTFQGGGEASSGPVRICRRRYPRSHQTGDSLFSSQGALAKWIGRKNRRSASFIVNLKPQTNVK